jgi:hypothetical protein
MSWLRIKPPAPTGAPVPPLAMRKGRSRRHIAHSARRPTSHCQCYCRRMSRERAEACGRRLRRHEIASAATAETKARRSTDAPANAVRSFDFMRSPHVPATPKYWLATGNAGKNALIADSNPNLIGPTSLTYRLRNLGLLCQKTYARSHSCPPSPPRSPVPP